MKITTKYLFHVVGEDPAQISRLHHSTIKRIKAFAIAIHIPVALWAVTGYLIAAKIFELNDETAKTISFFCSALIYLIERLVIATPKVWFVNLGRALIGIVIAILGASAVDLVIFDREVSQQLMASERSRIAQGFDKQISDQAAVVASIKNDWSRAQAAANCEANGSCGSGTRSLGPIYRELAKQADLLRKDYLAAVDKLGSLTISSAGALTAEPAYVVTKAGLLARVQALHEYTLANTAALAAWALFFLLVLLLEMMVVLSKLVFGETVDDRINAIREAVNDHKAAAFKAVATSPVANANQLLDGIYGFNGKMT
jgi:hypothetical protein